MLDAWYRVIEIAETKEADMTESENLTAMFDAAVDRAVKAHRELDKAMEYVFHCGAALEKIGYTGKNLDVYMAVIGLDDVYGAVADIAEGVEQ